MSKPKPGKQMERLKHLFTGHHWQQIESHLSYEIFRCDCGKVQWRGLF